VTAPATPSDALVGGDDKLEPARWFPSRLAKAQLAMTYAIWFDRFTVDRHPPAHG